MSIDLVVDHDVDATVQFILDQDGDQTALAVSTDRVGVNTISPRNALGIQGLPNGWNEYLSFRTEAATMWHINGGGTGGTGLNFAESGVADNRLFLQPGGNVGIGTGAPTAMLDVNGTIKGTGLEISGPLNFDAQHLTISNLTTPPAGVHTTDLVVDVSTGKVYRQN